MKLRTPEYDLQKQYDLAVIGGGIYGAWTAYEASRRGYQVVLLEQNDFACGTSSQSSKLVHGGLRYLEHGHLGLVRKSVRERANLLNLGPHRVWPLRFMVPLYQGGRWKSPSLKLGLMVYDLFTWGVEHRFAPHQNHRHHSRAELAEQFPHLKQSGLKSAYSYEDAQTDDARLTLEVILGAEGAGAHIFNHHRVLAVDIGKTQHGLYLENQTGESLEVHARTVLNAAGPWMPQVSGGMIEREQLAMTKGVHLVLAELPLRDTAFLLLHPQDGRVFFVIPWQSRTLVGTTDTFVKGDVLEVRPEDADEHYLLEGLNHHFDFGDQVKVCNRFCGIRVLQRQLGKGPSALSREWIASELAKGYFVSIGGKLTTARVDAQSLVDKVGYRCKPNEKCERNAALPWAPENFPIFLRSVQEQGQSLGLDSGQILSLLRRYGRHVLDIYERIQNDAAAGQRLDPELPFCRAELDQALEREYAMTFDDLFERRVPLLKLGGTVPDQDKWKGLFLKGFAS
ncbi:MAG: glycerol-3-phosphate dehydrogenase/oxidase [Acidobacteria bacterium]|nr:glycerol-3-phosphate dehydrogenase/oxidase [Acidobacteriota bacterium]MCB9397077.1 glycerol-3-phosphate dehydrogenase/oxidase [Acidobacteriota bacterium]